MIAIAVSVIALASAIQAQLAAREMIDEGREIQIATGHLRSQLDLVEQAGLVDVWTGNAGYVDGQAVAAVDLAPLSEATLTFETPGAVASPLPPEVLVVTLRLDWRALSGGTRSMTLTTALR